MGSDALDLLKFPQKAVDNILDHLNFFHLMNLRLVCKTTKSWVETPCHLKRFYVHVKQRKFLKTLLKSSQTVKWSNLTISCDINDPTNTTWIRADEYFQTFARLSTALRVLRFTEQRITYSNGLDVILRNCSELETLEIGTLDLQNVSLPVTSVIQHNLENHLKRFGISYVAWNQEKDLQWFDDFLGAAKKLEYFRVPFILSSSVYNLYPSLDVDDIEQKLCEITDQYLFNPVKAILMQENSRLRRLQVENFDLEQLLQNSLIQTCQQSGCLLVHVLECFERPVTLEESALLGDTVGSLLNCSKNLDISKLKKLQAVSIQDDCVESSDVDKKFCNGEQPFLKTVTITLTKSILQSERMAFCFLQQKRDSVTSISVTFQSDLKGSAQASVFRTPKFAACFPNLTTLRLNGFDGKRDEYLLFWNSFPRLEDLRLENCRTLGDSGLTGDDTENPAFLLLNGMKRLSLEYCDNLTDSILSTVISKMPLEYLSLALTKITFHTGLKQLVSIGGLLQKSLFVFQCIKPEDCDSDEMFKNYLSTNTFQNLKKSEILF